MSKQKDEAVLDSTENDNSAESSTEANNKVDTQSSEGDNTQDDKSTNFMEHPRFKELIEENRNFKSKAEEFEQWKQKYDPLLSKFQQDEKVEVPPWFGGNAEAYKLYKEDQRKEWELAKSEAIKEVESKSTRERQLYSEAQEHLNTSIAEIEKEVGSKIDRNRLLKVTEENKLWDKETGKWDYKLGYKFMDYEDLKKSASEDSQDRGRNSRTKRIIDISSSEKSVEQKDDDIPSNETFQHKRPW